MSSGVLIRTPLYATPPISSVGVSTVPLDNQLFVLTAVEDTDTLSPPCSRELDRRGRLLPEERYPMVWSRTVVSYSPYTDIP